MCLSDVPITWKGVILTVFGNIRPEGEVQLDVRRQEKHYETATELRTRLSSGIAIVRRKAYTTMNMARRATNDAASNTLCQLKPATGRTLRPCVSA